MLAEAHEDLAACHRLLKDGSRSFLAASRILPRDIARAACALYAFCRQADDCVDQDQRQDALADLNDRLDGIYAGAPRPMPADRAFAAVVSHFRIPRAWPRALFEGFEWDAQGRDYEDLPQLLEYAARVAGSVGAMMARVMGVQARAPLARACELGVAMQLTNIARDVGDDAAMGRLYLPRTWMREAGIDPDAWLERPVFSPALASVVRRLLDEAERRYQGGACGFGSLPIGCRPGIRAAALLYSDIGRAVSRRGFDSVSGRATVGAARKLQLVSWAALGSLITASGSAAAPPSQIDFLVEAAGPAPHTPPAAPSSALVVLQLFERLERRDRGYPTALATAGRSQGARA